ncbi:glycosyltransferase family 4 protein [Occallatibacter savannae]|uniref:glycosyltransferase family 4 protein n=1 Tax=Occallatibacter savannae TaxID=1002691 RepID=UPI0013A564C1|nr:glycosyltransferase family 1 protein [Occallatibacter savannae]
MATYVTTVLGILPEIAASRGVEVVAYEASQRPLEASHPNLRKIRLDSGCYSLAAQLQLAIRAERDGLDLLHTPFYLAPFFVNCPTLITIHDVMPFLFPIYDGLRGCIVRAGYRASALRASHVVCVSDTTRNDIIRVIGILPPKVTRVYGAIRHHLFHPAQDPSELHHLKARFGIEQPYVMVMSASNWKTKNLSASLEAIEAARDFTAIPFQTVITGSPIGLDQTGWRGKLRNAVETGFIESGDMQKLYRNAALFITLSKYEGFGLQLAEGLASGTPCVVSDGGSLPEVAGDGAIVCPLSDPDSAVRAIVDLLQSDNRRDELSRKALARAAAFSRERLAEGLLDLYAKISRSSEVPRPQLQVEGR